MTGGVHACRKTEQPECSEIVVRTWKRDGSTNFMNLSAAADNLASNIPGRLRSSIIRDLIAGVEIDTRLATFSLL